MKKMKLNINTVSFLLAIIAVLPIAFTKAQNVNIETINDSVSTTTQAQVLTAPAVLVAPKTSAYLTGVLDSLMTNTIGANTDSNSDFCLNLNKNIASLSTDQRESLAWNTTSYALSANSSLIVKENATLHEKTKTFYSDVNSNLSNLNSISTLSVSDRALFNAQKAIIRSFAIESVKTARTMKNPEQKVSDLTDFAYKTLSCLEDKINEESKDSFNLIKSSILNTNLGSISIKQENPPIDATVSRKISVSQKRDINDDVDIGKITNPSLVHNTEDLRSFMLNVLTRDLAVRKISVNGHVEVTYAQKGKLFGFIPHWYKMHVKVSEDGIVKSKSSFFGFLTKKIAHPKKAEIKANIDSQNIIPTDENGKFITPTTQEDSLFLKAKILDNVTNFISQNFTQKLETPKDLEVTEIEN